MGSIFRFFLILLLLGCSNSKINMHSKPVHYRSFDNPVRKVTTFTDASSPFEEICIQWEIAHNQLSSSVSGRLSKLEAHRKTIENLQKIIAKSSPAIGVRLKKFIDKYQNLLTQSDNGMPPRVVVRKYRQLRNSIAKLLYVVQTQ